MRQLMLQCMMVFFIQSVESSSCFTSGSWNTVRDLVGDITAVASLTECQHLCLATDKCAACSFSTASRCALLGPDTGRQLSSCSSGAVLYKKDTACGPAQSSTTSTKAPASTAVSATGTETSPITTTSTITSMSSPRPLSSTTRKITPTTTYVAATAASTKLTTTAGDVEICKNKCYLGGDYKGLAYYVDTPEICEIYCGAGLLQAFDGNAWKVIDGNLIACHSKDIESWCGSNFPSASYQIGSRKGVTVRCQGIVYSAPVAHQNAPCPTD